MNLKVIKGVFQKVLFLIMLTCFELASNAAKLPHPSLIPLPQNVKWTNENFLLKNCKAILINDVSLKNLAVALQKITDERSPIVFKRKTNLPFIELKLEKIDSESFPEEAYKLVVSRNKISLLANSPHGIFNGLQTLSQLIANGKEVAGCEILDSPSYCWRGYMVDVGRNYQSLKLLKQQIEIMSRYKLNVFHFHPTEDIAWRIAIKRYPQLTDSQNMIRDKGKFYSKEDIKDLIKYCRDRFITFVPEIDMPGHSAAFTRTFGFDMQSEKGLAIIKNIVKEFCDTYDVPYLHIGADEVKFTNKNFILKIVDFIHKKGKQTIGWHPGGNYDDATIRQLWESKGLDNPNAQYIDSRSLYLNHMDPEESVVSIFERQLLDTTCGNAKKLGGEICLWNDRRVGNENDLLRMNPVYPAMLAFAERSWRGGGFKGMVVNIGDSAAKAFREFENRVIDQKKKYFHDLPFPYVRQSDLHWKMFGPFENKGDLKTTFWPENKNISLADSTADARVTGGTIYLRHWWFPTLTSWLKDPKENTTWYAYTKIWKPADTSGFMWIGFNNLSRSTATDAPENDTWDNRQSEILLNGKFVAPPHWQNAGKKGNSETPLVDEGYEYRAPTKVHFKKGWNTILVKLPVKTFRGKDWQNPVKWMFTVVPVHNEKGMNWIADKIEKE